MSNLSDNILKAECKRLWKEAFGDSDEFISSFMELYYSKENMLYIEDKGKIVSMLHIIPFGLSNKPIAYMYAVATDITARGKGLATQLIKQAIEYAKEKGYKAIITLPAESELQKFYSQFGFCGSYAVKFETKDKFDFGTGDSKKDFITVLPFEKDVLTFFKENEITTLRR